GGGLQGRREVLREGHPLRPLDPRHRRGRHRPGEHRRARQGRRGRRQHAAAIPRRRLRAGSNRPGTGRLARMEDRLRHPPGVSRLISRTRRPVVPRLRWWIGALLFASTVINYVDRQTLSVLAPYLKAEYHWTNTDFALIIIAFRASYAIV